MAGSGLLRVLDGHVEVCSQPSAIFRFEGILVRDKVGEFNQDQAKIFCAQLWHELTVSGRAVWSDTGLSIATQLNCLKWLNEIQHRVRGAYSNPSTERLTVLLDQIIGACEQAPELGLLVRFALDRAISSVDGRGSAP